MTREFEVGVRLTADGKSLVGEAQSAKRAISGLGDAAKKTGSEFGQASTQNNAYAASMQQLKDGILGVVAAIGLVKVGQMAKETAELSQRYGELGIAMHAVGRNAGLSAAEIDAQAQAVQRSGISMIESRSIISRLITANIDLSKATQLARSAQDAAVIGQINSSEALDRMVHGIIAAEVEVLRGIGINVSFENSYKKMAEQLGITTAEMSENQKMQARVNVVLEAGAKNAGVYEAAMGNAGKMMRSTERLAEDLQVKIGGLFDQAMMLGVTTYTNLLKFLNQTIDDLTTSGAIERWGDNIARAFAFVIDMGRGVISLFKVIGMGIATTVEQAAALMTLDFDRVAGLDKSYSQFIDNERQGLTKNLDLVEEQIKSRKKLTVSTQEHVTAINNEAIVIDGANESARQSIGVRKQQISEADKFLTSLIKETDSVGKNKFELLRLEAAKLGVLRAAAPLIDALQNTDKALKAAEESASKYRAELSRAADITASVMTEEERLAEAQTEINRLHQQGFLSTETYNRALQSAEKQFMRTGETGKQALDEISQFSIQAQRNLQNALGDALFDGINGRFGDMVDGFARAIQQMLAQALAADIWGSLFGKKTGNMAGLFSAFGSSGSAGGAGGGMGGLLNMASLGSSAASLFGSGFGTLGAISSMGSMLPGAAGSFFTGLGVSGGGAAASAAGFSGAASMGASVAAMAGPLIALAAVDQIGRLLAGDKSTGTIVDSIPVIGGFAGALFGRGPMKFREQQIRGYASATGFDGEVADVFRAKGGLLVGNKHQRQGAANEDALLELFDTTIQGYTESTRKFAEALGLSADSIDTYTQKIFIRSAKGQQLTEDTINQMLASIGDGIARGVVPQIGELAKSGESAYQTLQRLAGEFDVLVGLGAALGNSLADTKAFLRSVAIEDRSAFVDQAGGSDALSQNIAFFSQNYLTEAERLAPVIESVTDKMAELGLEGIKTKEQFRDLVRAQDLTTEAGQQVFVELMDIQGAFLTVANAAEQTEAAAKAAAAAIANEAESLNARYLQTIGDKAGLRQLELDKTDPSNRGALQQIFDTEDANAINTERLGLERQLLELNGDTAALREMELNALDPSNRELQKRIWMIEDEAALTGQNNRDAEIARGQRESDLKTALGILDKAVQTEIGNIADRFKAMLSEVDDSIKATSASIASLKSLSAALSDTVEKIQGISVSEARSQIGNAIREASLGNVVQLDSIRGALTTLGSQSDAGFSSREDYLRSRSGDASLVDALNEAVGYQLSVEEETLGVLEEQKKLLQDSMDIEIKTLTDMLETAKKQVDSVLGVDKSLHQLLGGKSAFVRSMQSMAISIAEMVKSLQEDSGVKGFASGGNHIGGLRIVGENGPELEATGPARIYSNAQLQRMLSADADTQASPELAEAVKQLAALASENNRLMRQVQTIMERASRGQDAFYTKVA